MPLLEGDRVRLRALAIEDSTALHEVYADADLMTWWSHGPHATEAQTREHIAQRVDTADWRTWAITLRDEDRAIGTVGAHEKRQGNVVEIGYSLARRHWGQGIAREAIGLLLDYLFEVEGHRRAFADADPENIASNGLLTRLGFTLEGRLRGEWETHIGVRDSLIWGLLREEWRRSEPPPAAG